MEFIYVGGLLIYVLGIIISWIIAIDSKFRSVSQKTLATLTLLITVWPLPTLYLSAVGIWKMFRMALGRDKS